MGVGGGGDGEGGGGGGADGEGDWEEGWSSHGHKDNRRPFTSSLVSGQFFLLSCSSRRIFCSSHSHKLDQTALLLESPATPSQSAPTM